MRQQKNNGAVSIFLWLSVLLAMGTGCGDDVNEWQKFERQNVRHNLIGFNGDAAFLRYARQAAMDRVLAQVEVSRKNDIEWLTNPEYRTGIAVDDVAASDNAAESAQDAKGGTDVSKTNTQEAGVDEADVVKTDGSYIYALSRGRLEIVSAVNGMMEKAGTVDLGGYAKEMYIFGDVAVVFSNRGPAAVPESIQYPAYGYFGDADYAQEPVQKLPSEDPALDAEYCGSWGCDGGTYLQMSIIDLSVKTSPVVVRTAIYGAQYVTSRMINGIVRLVLSSPMPKLELIWDMGDNADWDSVSGINAAYQHMLAVNDAAISALTIDDILPGKWDSLTQSSSRLVESNQITAPETPNGVGLQTIVSLDLKAPLADSMQAGIFSQQGVVYASQNSLYLTSGRDWVSLAMESGLWGGQENQTTGIHKFNIGGDRLNIAWEASGTVPGRLLNQFSMSEKDGMLRLATTTGDWWRMDGSNTLDNHIFILGQNGKKLESIGQLDGLGAGEEIYAARFVGDKAFLVTFLQTDPLYTIDLADPTHPKMIGEWIGPGYSTYLHPWGDHMLLAVGVENWTPAISLYDVSDFSSPQLVQRSFLTETEWSMAVYEHKAVTFNEETGFLAIPYTSWANAYETGIHTYQLSTVGITSGESLGMYRSIDGMVEADAQRSLYIGDYMYGMSRCRLVSAAISAPSVTASELPLFEGAGCDDDQYYFYGGID